MTSRVVMDDVMVFCAKTVVSLASTSTRDLVPTFIPSRPLSRCGLPAETMVRLSMGSLLES
jgi:hypothetical protein